MSFHERLAAFIAKMPPAPTVKCPECADTMVPLVDTGYKTWTYYCEKSHIVRGVDGKWRYPRWHAEETEQKGEQA